MTKSVLSPAVATLTGIVAPAAWTSANPAPNEVYAALLGAGLVLLAALLLVFWRTGWLSAGQERQLRRRSKRMDGL